jgi:hypothetical protein
MVRTILGFAVGFVLGGLVVDSGSAKKFRAVAAEKAARLREATCENAARVKSATRKAAAVVRDEFSKKEDGAEETT